jgi:hypothetical protein
MQARLGSALPSLNPDRVVGDIVVAHFGVIIEGETMLRITKAMVRNTVNLME